MTIFLRGRCSGARTYVDIMFLKDFKFTLNLSSDISAYNGSSFENKIVGDGAPAGRGERVNSLTNRYNSQPVSELQQDI